MSSKRKKPQTGAEALTPATSTPDNEEPKTNVLTLGTHCWSPATLVFIEAIATIAQNLWTKVLGAPGHVPDFRIIPGLPLRGATGSAAGVNAQTFTAIPETRTVALLKETVEKDGEKRHSIKASKAGVKEETRISDKATIILSPLTFTSHDARDGGTMRSTFDMLSDVLRAFLFLSSGYAPGVAGTAKVAALKTLLETIKKSYGATFEPAIRVQMDRTVVPAIPKRNKAGDLVTRTDYTILSLPDALRTAITHAILESGLPADPPSELRLDFLAFLNADRRPTNPIAKAETVTINGQKMDFRTTMSQLRNWLATVPEGTDTLTVTLRFPADAIEQARKMRTVAEAAQDREDAARAASGVLRTVVDPAPRIGQGPAATV